MRARGGAEVAPAGRDSVVSGAGASICEVGLPEVMGLAVVFTVNLDA